MKKLPLYAIAILALISCSQDTQVEIVSIDIKGSVTKGSYLPGSNISFNELEDRELRQTGDYYFSIIDNANGEYELNIDDLEEDIALAVANGYYWDEVRNQVSDGELDLVGIFEWSSELNVNVLSHLESERVKYLIQNDLIGGRRSKRFAKAKKQALNEVLTAFGIDQEYGLSESFSFFSGDNKSKILLAISSVLQADRDTYEIASLLAQLRVDIKEDGIIDNEDLREEIGSRLCILDIEQIAANVYQRLGDDFPGLEEDSLVSDYLDEIKAEFSGYECDPKVNPGPNAIAIGLLTEAIDDNCNELTFFTDLDNDGSLDDNETVINKITICNGTDGEDGSDGEDAVSIKVITSAAADCGNGGTKFSFYLDINNNNQKDDDEVVVTETTICNGEDGSDGENGEDAIPLGVKITDASTEECPAGGQKITIFRDADSDGVLDDGEEVLDTAVVCNGEDDTSGQDSDGDGVSDANDLEPDTRIGAPVDENGVMLPPIVLDDNGVTVRGESWSIIGDTLTINDINYKVVGESELRSRVNAKIELSSAVTTKITDMSRLFYLNDIYDYGDLSTWDVSNVISLKEMFNKSTEIKWDLSKWNVSNVVDMSSIWENAIFSENFDISSWDVSNVFNMNRLFSETNFNSDISNWDVSKVQNFQYAFAFTEFNQDISKWDTSSATTFEQMFGGNEEFNQDISQWNTSSVEIFDAMFQGATSFNQDIGEWDVSNAQRMLAMFQRAESFNQDLREWCVSGINGEPLDFSVDSSLSSSNKPIWGFCPETHPIFLDDNGVTVKARESAVVGETYSLYGDEFLVVDEALLREKVNQASDLTKLVTTRVTDMSNLFALPDNGDRSLPKYQIYSTGSRTTSSYTGANGGINFNHYQSTFDQDISNWDTSNVTDMRDMFVNLDFFSADLSNWDVSNVYYFDRMFALMQGGNNGQGSWEIFTSETNELAVSMEAMYFLTENFNQNISGWATSAVFNMQSMFQAARAFNQDLSNWNVGGVNFCRDFSSGANSWTLDKPFFTACSE